QNRYRSLIAGGFNGEDRHKRTVGQALRLPNSATDAVALQLRASIALLLYRLGFWRALLRVDHNTSQRIDRAQHLWILGLDDIGLVVGLNIPRVAQRIKHPLLLGAHAHANIRRHAVTLNDLS